jgi:DNA-directed RNA polymerase specialized sigma24 family protein
MPKQNPNAAAEAETSVSASERIARILALFLVKDLAPGQAIIKLDTVGFSPADIARLLDTTTNNVGVAKFKHRQSGKKKKKSD